MKDKYKIPAEIYEHYSHCNEAGRLDKVKGVLEFERSKQIISRYLKRSSLSILDIGGGPGKYSFWLSALGHTVDLIDPMPNLIEIAKGKSESKELNKIEIGDVRLINEEDNNYDIIICFGPFYHLTNIEDRKVALNELQRVLKPGGIILIAGISKFVSLIESGMFNGMLEDPVFQKIVGEDLKTGQHRNPIDSTTYFTTSIFMKASELHMEVEKSGFTNVEAIAVEGPGWMHKNLNNIVKDTEKLTDLMSWITRVESEESIIGISTHFIIKAIKASE